MIRSMLMSVFRHKTESDVSTPPKDWQTDVVLIKDADGDFKPLEAVDDTEGGNDDEHA